MTSFGCVVRGCTARRGLTALMVLGMLTGAAACSSDSPATPAASTPAAAPAAEGAHLSPDAFEARMKESGTVLLDVRAPAEFASGHISGAKNIDYRAADFPQRLEELDKNVRYALYCRSGIRSNDAMKLMLGAGFTDVADLAGGITAWSRSKRSVVKD